MLQMCGPSCLWIKRCVLSAQVVLNSFLHTLHLFTETLVFFPEPTGVRSSASSVLGRTEVNGQDVEVFLRSVSNEKGIHSGLNIQKTQKQHRNETCYVSYLNQTWSLATVLNLWLAGLIMVRRCRSHHWTHCRTMRAEAHSDLRGFPSSLPTHWDPCFTLKK